MSCTCIVPVLCLYCMIIYYKLYTILETLFRLLTYNIDWSLISMRPQNTLLRIFFIAKKETKKLKGKKNFMKKCWIRLFKMSGGETSGGRNIRGAKRPGGEKSVNLRVQTTVLLIIYCSEFLQLKFSALSCFNLNFPHF